MTKELLLYFRLDDGIPTTIDYEEDADESTFEFDIPEPSVVHTSPVDASTSTFEFETPQPSVTRVPAGYHDPITVTIGDPTIEWVDQLRWVLSGNNRPKLGDDGDSYMFANQNLDYYLAMLLISDRSGANNSIRFARSTSEADTVGGSDLISDWENHPSTAITLRAGAYSLTLSGPNRGGSSRDSNDPYDWQFTSAERAATTDFITAFRSLTQAEKDGTTLTLDGGLRSVTPNSAEFLIDAEEASTELTSAGTSGIQDTVNVTQLSDWTDLFSSIGTNGSQGLWNFRDASANASTPTGNTGPATNNSTDFAYTETSGSTSSATYPDDWETNGIAQFATIPNGVNRKLHLRVCIQGRFAGDGAGDTDEGLEIEYRTSTTGTWERAGLLNGWAYASLRTAGTTASRYGGGNVNFALNGGWVDDEVDIPDVMPFKLDSRPRYLPGGGDSNWNHDIAIARVQWEASSTGGYSVSDKRS